MQEALEEVKIALGGFRGEKLSGQDFAGSIVLHAQSGEQRAAAFEPIVGRAVQLHEFTFTSRAQTALTMRRWTAFARRADATGAQQATQGFAAEGEALLFNELFMEMVVVETGVTGARQSEDAFAGGLRSASVAGAAAADVSQSRCAALPIARFETFDMSSR